jgi:hypothetical protein
LNENGEQVFLVLQVLPDIHELSDFLSISTESFIKLKPHIELIDIQTVHVSISRIIERIQLLSFILFYDSYKQFDIKTNRSIETLRQIKLSIDKVVEDQKKFVVSAASLLI